MRYLTRALTRTATALACAVALATCADAPTAPSRSGLPARLAFAPQFSASASSAAAALRQAGIEIASVRVVIRRTTTGDELFNRVIPVASGASSITLEADVLLRSAEEQLTAFMEFLDAAGTVLYRGEQQVLARAGNDNAVTIDTEIEFVGPGSTAATVRVTPADTAISTATPLALKAVALDAAGAPITSAIMLWSSSDAALATVSTLGLVTPRGPRGTVQVSARTPLGIAGTATLRLMPPAVRVVVIGGGGQSGTAGSTLAQPFTVEVQAADGLPVPGETVTFSAVTPGGAVTNATVTADAQGRASTPIKLGTAAGRYEFRAVSGSLGAVTITADAAAGTPAAMAVLSGNGQSATVGTALAAPLVVKVRDTFGNLVAGATVKWQVLSGSGTLAALVSTSDASGHASVAYKVGNVPATETVKATLDGTSITATFTATATLGPAAAIAIVSGNGQTGEEGSVLAAALVVQVKDALGNLVPGAPVTWAVTSSNATLAQATTATDANAKASNTVTLGSPSAMPATAVITATLASGTSVTFTATITAKPLVPAKLLITQQPPSAARSGIALGAPVKVQVADSAGAPLAVAGQPVTASVYSASVNRLPADASVSSSMLQALALSGTTSVTTDASGVAIFPDLTITGTEGPVTLSFTSGSLPVVSSNTITLAAGDVAKLTIMPSAPTVPFVVTSGQPIAENVWLETSDASGNRVADVPVRFIARSGGAGGPVVGDTTLVSNSIGEIGGAAFPVPTATGTYHVTASISASGAEPVTFTVQVNASTANATTSAVGETTIPINVGPVAIGSRSVVVRTAEGAGLPGMNVTYTLSGAGTNGSFTGEVHEVSSVTDANGVASFPSGVMWTPPAPEGSYVMTVVARDGATQVGGTVTFTAVRTQWRYHVTATPAAPAPSTHVALTAQLVDGNGASLTVSPVRNVTWSKAVGTAPATSFATTSLASDGSTSTGFTSDAASGAVHTITVTDNNYAITGTATVTNTGSPAASAIVYGGSGPAASGDLQVGPSGDTLVQPLLVKVLDGNGAPLANVGVEWRHRSSLSEAVVVDTTTTDGSGIASLRPALPVEDPHLGHVFEASPVATSLVLRFRAVARDGTEDAVWFGPAVGDGSTPLGYADWSTGSNWSGGIVPGTGSNVLIPGWDNAWVASPQLTGTAAAMRVATAPALDFPYLNLGVHELAIGSAITGSLVAGTGTIRMTGTSASVDVYAPSATLAVPAGAHVALVGFTQAKHVTVGGTLQVGIQSLQLEGGELLVTGQLLMGGGSVYGASNVVFDNTAFDSAGTGSITFGKLFEQRGTTALDMPEYFTVYADLGAGGATATLKFADSSSSLGALVVTGPDAGTRSTLVIDGSVEVSGEFVVNGLVDVSGAILRLESDNVILPETADLSGLATLESHGYYAPMFAGAAPQMTELWAAELNGPSQYNNLRIRESVQVYWHPFLVNGNLEVLGPAGALRMMSDQDTLVVKGNLTFASDSAGTLRRGVVRLGGHLSYSGSADFQPDTLSTGTKFVFEGTAEQKVAFEPQLRAAVTYLGNLEVRPGSTVRQSTPLTIAGHASIAGTWIADSGLVVDGRIDVLGGEKPGRLETHAGTNIRRLDMQTGSQWWNGASSALGLNAANFFQGSQIWNYAGDSVYAEVCYNAGYVMMDNTQVYFSCSLQYPYGYVASLAPMPTAAPSPAAASRP